ncbi:hypothetical protein GCM10028828_08030 [Corynebacterium tapiri]
MGSGGVNEFGQESVLGAIERVLDSSATTGLAHAKDNAQAAAPARMKKDCITLRDISPLPWPACTKRP